MNCIKIGSHKIGSGYPVYIVAEIGINHNGDMKLAKKTILAAKTSGASAVKFQNYKTEDFLVCRNLKHTYTSQGKEISEPQYEMFKRYELSDEQVRELKEFCDENEIDFHSTPTSFSGVDLLKDIGVSVLKNGSDFFTNLELIKYMGKTGLPTVLSTGMAAVSEIDEAVRTFRSTGNNNLILLHCTSSYPTLPEDVNLKKINTLRVSFNAIVGFSDHSRDVWAAVCSVMYNSAWIEKHFTLDKTLPGPDHQFSCDPEELKRLVEGVRVIEKSIGGETLGPTLNEETSREGFRLSCASKVDLKKGDIIARGDIIFVRPGTGIPPKDVGIILGKRINKDVNAHAIFSHDMF